jgi:DNA-binding NarL/FixJ family response regulator
MSQMRILVADDHAVVRECLVRMLSDQQDMRVVAEAGTGEQALVAALATVPHVVLLDVRMPGVGGVATIRKLRETLPRVQVLVLSTDEDPRHRRAALAAGADGFLGKSATAAEIVRTLRSLQSGHTPC